MPFYDGQDELSHRAGQPGGHLWLRADDDGHDYDSQTPCREDLYPEEQLEYEQDQQRRWREARRVQDEQEDEGRRREGHTPLPSPRRAREESDASLEVMDIATYANTLRISSTNNYRSQQQQAMSPTTFNSPRLFAHQGGHPLPPPSSSFYPEDYHQRPHHSTDYHHALYSPLRPLQVQHYDSPPPSQDHFSRPPPPPSSSSPSSYTSQPRGYHYDPAPDSNLPGFFPPDSILAHSDATFASSAPHHLLHQQLDPSNGEGEADPATVKGFPRWSREWFKVREVEGEGEQWEGGGLTGGDLGDASALLSPSARGADAGSVEARIKAKRMRKLEKEFGVDVGGVKPKANDRGERRALRLPGELSSRGRLVSTGPRKRLALRWIEGLLGLAACGLAMWPLLRIHPTPPPPPSGTLPSLLLSIFSVLSLVLTLALLLVRPLCCSSAKKLKHHQHPHNPLGTILPVSGGGNKGKKGAMPGGFNIQLVVDPRSFQQPRQPRRKRKSRRARKREAADELLSSSSDSSSSSEDDSPPQPSFAVEMARRERRAWARKWIVRMVWHDVLVGLGWAVVFGLAMAKGKRCPVGGFQGWCDCYNSATACSVMLALCFWGSAVLGVRDAKLKDPRRVGDEV